MVAEDWTLSVLGCADGAGECVRSVYRIEQSGSALVCFTSWFSE